MSEIAEVASDFEEVRTRVGGASKDLLQVWASTTACSSTVFNGLLTWASLNAHLPSKAEITTVEGRQDTGHHS